MSYEKQTWATGDTITADKLNHMEDGIATGGGVLVVHGAIDGAIMTLDKTWQEIYDADATLLRYTHPLGGESFAMLLTIYEESDLYKCTFTADNAITFTTDSADGYPSVTMG